VALAAAADYTFSSAGSVLNMHYKNMGLHGSEFWSYSLKKRVGKLNTRALIQGAEPVIGK
jgi:putative two-component system hydrogenase maturation factor HypX/HoxX